MWTDGKIVPQELIDILCDDSTGCKNESKNDFFHRSRHNDKRFI